MQINLTPIHAGSRSTASRARRWYAHRDLLGVLNETVIPETSTFEQTATTILHVTGLASAAPQTPCPRRGRHCARESAEAAAVAVGDS
ncbi:hypothetical protein [Micromonospora phaseoli]|uniref:hypothetical protein n=1 Tax=Micromonospora phaseoli TaxID=1144548 RepID=UPI000DB611A3|nr:hypothetical protein [Micromonospora phaseoli]PZV89408.1 hypothetical protein CLV64_1158 [Micromonospora phaseoli]GIJ81449.1 hypothetical protein Xph01_58810 [Micromonospora phaseoli]